MKEAGRMVQTGKFGDYPEAVISDGALKCTVTAFGAAVRSLAYEGTELVL